MVIYGVTDDGCDLSPDITRKVLNSLGRRPAVRLVFDQGRPPDDYQAAVRIISKSADILAQPVDSSWSSRISIEDYVDRFREYVSLLSPYIWQWEVGNEINGDWQAGDIIARVKQSNNVVSSAGGKSHLCLYGAYGMDTFLDAADFDGYEFESVGISYYEQDNHGEPYDWFGGFSLLNRRFPHSKLLISEFGAAHKAKKIALINYYYRELFKALSLIPNFEGGGFYWYFRQDCFNKAKPYFDALRNAWV